jgi:ABC-2 type transport system ATP-binding protein
VNKTSGRVSVFGYDLQKDVVNAKRQLGLVPQEFNFNPFETVQQIVVNQAGYYGVERKEALERSEKYLKQLDLWEKRNERADVIRRDEAPPDDCPCADARAKAADPR